MHLTDAIERGCGSSHVCDMWAWKMWLSVPFPEMTRGCGRRWQMATLTAEEIRWKDAGPLQNKQGTLRNFRLKRTRTGEAVGTPKQEPADSVVQPQGRPFRPHLFPAFAPSVQGLKAPERGLTSARAPPPRGGQTDFLTPTVSSEPGAWGRDREQPHGSPQLCREKERSGTHSLEDPPTAPWSPFLQDGDA